MHRDSSLSTARSFDLKVTQRGGTEHQFSSIPKDEYKNLVAYFKGKNIKVRSDLDTDGNEASARVDYNEGDAGSDEDSRTFSFFIS